MENTNDEEVDNSGSKRKSYPIRELRYIVDFVAKIYDTLGFNLYHSREDIAKLHDLEVNTIKQVLSTAQQYGLLDLKHGTGYKATDLFVKIHKPLNETEKLVSIIESLRNSDIIRKLLEDYNGHSVPIASGITNNIVRSFGLKDTIASRVADIFLKNVSDYNLVNLKNELVLSVKEQTKPPVDPPKDQQKPPADTDDSKTVIPIPLKSSGKKAYLHLPDGYTDADLNRIAKFVNALRDDEN